jgi:hypothetical protein
LEPASPALNAPRELEAPPAVDHLSYASAPHMTAKSFNNPPAVAVETNDTDFKLEARIDSTIPGLAKCASPLSQVFLDVFVFVFLHHRKNSISV